MTRTIPGRFEKKRPGPYSPGIYTPYIKAIVEIPRLRVKAPISFLVDTGADHTTVHAADAVTLGISELESGRKGNSRSVGIGGDAEYKPERAILHFKMGKTTYVWDAEIRIGPCGEEAFELAKVEDVPSLLGRDFLSRGRLVADYIRDQLVFEVHTDESILKKYNSMMSQQLIRAKAASRPSRSRRNQRR